jgi:hypothetical protein
MHTPLSPLCEKWNISLKCQRSLTIFCGAIEFIVVHRNPQVSLGNSEKFGGHVFDRHVTATDR